MYRLLFLLPSFQLGGTNSAFNNLLSVIDKNHFSIDVYAFDDKGPNRATVANYVNILGGSEKTPSGINYRSRMKDIVHSLKKIIMKLHIDISPIVFRHVAKRLSLKNYDCVIAFQEGQVTRFLTFFHDVYKIAWIHCDYKEYIASNHVKPEKDLYSKIDKIVCVSRYTQKSFLEVLPDFKSKTEYLYNALDVDAIIRKSKEGIDPAPLIARDCFKIVSIGRFSPVKRFDLIPKIAAQLKENGLLFTWVVIGDGPIEYKSIIAKSIKEYSVEDCVVCVGAKSNPYPLIAVADVLAITSLSEACPMVLSEAKVLGVPVLSTDYGSSREFIEDGEDGIICQIEEMPEALMRLMKDRSLYESIKNNLSAFKYPNGEIINKLENVILSS